MANLDLLQEPRVFPPKLFYPIVWFLTLVLSLYGIIFTPFGGGALYIWIVIGLVAVWQVWTIRWVHVDERGIRARNILQRGRELRWEEISVFHEEDVALNKRVYSIIDVANSGTGGARPTRIRITSDQVGFDMLRDIIRAAVPKQKA